MVLLLVERTGKCEHSRVRAGGMASGVSARGTLPASRSASGYMSVRGLAINGVQLRPVIAVGESVKNIAPHVEC